MSNGLEFTLFEDFEAYLLSELTKALLAIIHPDLYTVGGDPPDQTALFHTDRERVFVIMMINEIQSLTNFKIGNNVHHGFSLLTAMKLFIDRYRDESDKCGLTEALSKLNDWLKLTVETTFYAPDTGRSGKGAEVILKCDRKMFFYISANIYKHSLLKLSRMCKDIVKFCKYKNRRPIADENALSIIEPLQETLGGNIFIYHASAVLELYFNLFESIWKLLHKRSENFSVASMHPRIYPSNKMSAHAKNKYIQAISYGKPDCFNLRKPCRIVAMKFLEMRY